MRDFLNAILGFIGTTALTDAEFATIEAVAPVYDVNLYAELMSVLISREAVSSVRDRLRHFFMARAINVGEIQAGRSNIFVGAVLDD